ncbi:hypothetical protein [Deferrisoma sp.]
MRLEVECYAGTRADERPVRFRIGRRCVEVTEILDRWLGEDHRYFKVRGDDGATYILRLDLEADRWDLTWFDRSR